MYYIIYYCIDYLVNILFVINRYGIAQTINWYVKAGDKKRTVRPHIFFLI